jgi:hypothetical protein
MGYTDCSGYVSQALSLGVSPGEIESFKAANTNSDGTWDCHRLLEAFGGVREQQTQPSARVTALATATPLPPPVMAEVTTGADPRMFLTMENVPTSIGGGAPNRQLAPYVTSPMSGGVGGSSFSLTSPSGGMNWINILILAAIGFGAWYLLKKG